MISLAGCSSFKQSSVVQLQQVTIRTNRNFDLYDQGVSAGNHQLPFGESSDKIDLNELLINNETATFFCRVSGRSMEPHMRDGAATNGEMTLKRLSVVGGQKTLAAVNTDFPDVEVGI